MRRGRDNLNGATVLLYARRSKPDPRNPGKSTDDQLDTQRARAVAFGLNIAAEFTDDGIGASQYSAGKIRPGFVNAVEHLRSHPVEVFSIWELSRATRRLRVFGDLMEMCQERGTFLLVGDRVYDPRDATDQMVLGMTAVTDSAEVARLRERTLRGVASHAAAGKPHGRNAFGYERIYDPRTRALLDVRPHPEQAGVIAELVRRTLAGESAHGIVRDLNDRGVRKPSGARWFPGDVRDMLSNPTYRGLRAHKGSTIDAIWPALISAQDWAALTRVFSQRSRGIHDTTAKHLLTGIVMCARCRTVMYCDTRRTGRYVQTHYRCRGCDRSRNQQHLERYVRSAVDAALADPRTRARLIPPSDDGTVALQLAALNAELDEAYTLGLSPRGLKAVEDRLVPQIAALEQRVAAKPGVDLSRFDQLPDDPDVARGLLRSLVRVWVLPSRRGRGFDSGSVLLLPAGEHPDSVG